MARMKSEGRQRVTRLESALLASKASDVQAMSLVIFWGCAAGLVVRPEFYQSL